MKDMDWLELWRDLVTRNDHPFPEGLVERYREQKRKKTERADPLLDFILEGLDPSHTAIEIGPGAGRWTIPLAGRLEKVTAIEPTPGLAGILSENIAAAGLSNVDVLTDSWEDASPGVHDVVLCAHGMYGSADIAAFVGKMERLARVRCYFAIRLPPATGIMAELSSKVHGSVHDSVNAIVAYNAFHAMGIHANVRVEEEMVCWTNRNVEEAFLRARRHLCLQESETAHDGLIRETLLRRLSFSDGVYTWPDGMRSALLWWNPRHQDRK